MSPLVLVFISPLIGSAVLAFMGHHRNGRDINVAFSFLTFLASTFLTARVVAHGPMFALDKQFFIDSLNVFLVTLTALIGFTTSIFSRPYMRIEEDRGKMTPNRMRLYFSMYQLFNCCMLLALTTNNLGILWVAMEAATLTTVLLVSLYRTPESIEAAWKYFILCGVGIAQALFGTVLIYFAAENKLGGARGDTLLWTVLHGVGTGNLDPAVITLAFVFLLVGYG